MKEHIKCESISIYRDSGFSPNLQYSVRCQAISVDHRQCRRNANGGIHDVAAEWNRSNVLVESFPLRHRVTCTIFQTV